MAVKDFTLTQENLHNLFYYKNGQLFWKPFFGTRNRISKKSNKPVGSFKTDYITVSINNKIYYVHRMIFMFHHGYLPKQIDHIDNNKINNKIENLRKADFFSNAWNKKTYKNNTSGVKGVSWYNREQKWVAELALYSKKIRIGSFDSVELAKIAIEKARKKYHGEFANNGY
jgi:hypothetical protein